MARRLEQLQWVRRGSVGILSLITMALLGVIGSAFVLLSSTEVRTGAQYRDGVSAQYLAEAGARWAAVQLKTQTGTIISDTDSAAGRTYGPVSQGTAPVAGNYSVLIRRDPNVPADSNRRQVSVTGSVNQAKRLVVYVVTISNGGFPLKYATFSNKDLNLSSTVHGDIGAKEDVVLDWGYSADAVTGATIKKPGQKAVTSTPPSETLDFSLPSIPVPFDINDASYQKYLIGATVRAGDLNSGTQSWSGNNRVNGNLSIHNSASLTTTGDSAIYVNGNFSIDNNCVINATGDLTIIANGSITLNQSQIIMAAGKTLTLYAKNGVIGTSGATITGNTIIISPQTVDLSGNITIQVVDNGFINVYTQKNFIAGNSAKMKTQNVSGQIAAFTVMAAGNINLSGGTPFSPGSKVVAGKTVYGTVKLYAGGTFTMSGGATIAGYGLVMTGDTGNNSISLTGGIKAVNTVFLSSGDIKSMSGPETGPLYAKGNVTISGGATVDYNPDVFSVIGLSGGGTFQMLPWNNR